MARRNRTESTDSTTSTDPTVETDSTVTTLPEEATSMTDTVTEAPVEESIPVQSTDEAVQAQADAANAADAAAPAEAEKPVDLTAFTASVEVAVAQHDESTGVVPDEAVAEVTAAYRALDGLKAKNAAKKLVNDGMRDAMNEMLIQKARAYMVLSDGLTAGSGGGGGTKAEKVPADPTAAFVDKLATLYLASELVTSGKTDSVDANYGEKLDELLESSRDEAAAYSAWLTREAPAEGTEDTPEPEASNVVKAAAKLALGRSAKVGGTTRSASGGSSTPYTGERRDIGKHISEAFAGVESGTFLTVAQIRKFDSSQYTSESPASAGAISSRLFPQTGKCSIEGITPGQNADGNRGATKN